jgi:glycosyltransferase involved in cell wall biosynthesis
MNENPLVSIITPSYNRAPFIPLCLESVRRQSYTRIEHIVVDGGSRDGTVELLQGYAGSYNLRWVSEPDEGMYHALNKGIALARGNVVAYLNTDDAYFPWTVEVAVRHLVQREAPLVFGDLVVVQAHPYAIGVTVQFYRPFDLKYYTHFATLGQPTVFIRREVFRKVGYFDTAFRQLGDCEFWLRCAAQGLVPRKIDEVLALQIDHADTLRVRERRGIQEEFEKLIQKYGNVRYRRRHFWKENFKAKVLKRKTMATFLWRYLFGSDDRWVHFVKFLKASRLGFSTPSWLLSMFIPYKIRRRFRIELIEMRGLLEALGVSLPHAFK